MIVKQRNMLPQAKKKSFLAYAWLASYFAQILGHSCKSSRHGWKISSTEKYISPHAYCINSNAGLDSGCIETPIAFLLFDGLYTFYSSYFSIDFCSSLSWWISHPKLVEGKFSQVPCFFFFFWRSIMLTPLWTLWPKYPFQSSIYFGYGRKLFQFWRGRLTPMNTVEVRQWN